MQNPESSLINEVVEYRTLQRELAALDGVDLHINHNSGESFVAPIFDIAVLRGFLAWVLEEKIKRELVKKMTPNPQ